MILHLTPCSGLVYRDNSLGASFSTCNACLSFNCHLFLCLSVCRSVERPGTPYHYDWYPDRPPVVHLRLSKGLLPSAPSTTPRGTREPQTETLAETTTSCLNESLAMSSKKKKNSVNMNNNSGSQWCIWHRWNGNICRFECANRVLYRSNPRIVQSVPYTHWLIK